MNDDELLISLLIFNPDLVWKCKTEIQPNDLSSDVAAEAYLAVLEIASKYKGTGPIPIETLPKLSQDALSLVLRAVNHLAVDKSLVDIVIEKIKERSNKNKLLKFLHEIAATLEKKRYDDVVEEIGKFLRTSINAHTYVRKPSQIVDTIAASGPARFEVLTGISCIDDFLAPLRPSQFMVIGGATASGKTSFMLQLAQHYARLEHKVLLCTLEMSAEEVLIRMLRQATQNSSISLSTIKNDDVIQTIALAIDKNNFDKIAICDTARLSVDVIRNIVKSSDTKIDIIIVDYLQLMLTSGKNENRANEVSQISRGLKLIAKELDALVIAASQLSRRYSEKMEFLSQKDEFPIPQLSHLRESGSIEMDADTVLFVGRDIRSFEDPRYQPAFCHIAKQRFGESGVVVRLLFDKLFTKFVEKNDAKR